GETGSACLQALGERGRLLVYSSLSGEPIRFDPRVLMTADRRIEGFWLSLWARRQGVLRMLSLFRQITALIRESVAAPGVAATSPLDSVREAVRLAEAPGRQGKVLLRIGSR